MELYQLEELAALAEYGSISKAAESVGVSQPAMSRSIHSTIPGCSGFFLKA